jgi:hypothetical protein
MYYSINNTTLLSLDANNQLVIGNTSSNGLQIIGNVGIGTQSGSSYSLNINGNINLVNGSIFWGVSNYIVSYNLLNYPLTRNKIIFSLPSGTTIKAANVIANIDTTGATSQSVITYGANVAPLWVAGGYGTNSLAYSTNGIKWTGLGTTIFRECFAIAWNGSLWVAAGNGTANTLAYSTNGATWTGLGTTIFSTGYGIAWNGSLWVAGGDGTTNTLAYSTGGTEWTGLGKTIFNTTGRGISWNGSLWVAAGNGTANTLAYSTNGTTWTGLGKTIFSTTGRGISWNGSMWVAGGDGTTNTLAYSTNGTTWTGLGTTIFSTTGPGISWNGSMWVAAGGFENPNSLAYSTNGTTWTGLGTTIFRLGYAIAFNNAKPNTITFSSSANPGLVSGTVSQSSDFTISSGQTLEIVSDSYNQSGASIISLNIQG